MKLRPIKIVGDIAYVPLTKGYTAIIDAEDAELVGQYNWHVWLDKRKDGSIRQSRTKPITVYKYEKYAMQFTGKVIPVYTRDVNG